MPWDDGPGAGFTSGRPWLRLGPEVGRRNVAAQLADPGSVLACYRRILAVRRALPSLEDGSMTLLRMREPNVVAYRRVGSGREVVVVIAFGREGAVVRLPQPLSRRTWRTIAGSVVEPASPQGDGRTLRLRAWEAVILVAEGGSKRGRAAGS